MKFRSNCVKCQEIPFHVFLFDSFELLRLRLDSLAASTMGGQSTYLDRAPEGYGTVYTQKCLYA